jgi:two-component SAPR family response regulator
VPKLAIDDQSVTDDMWQTSKTKKLFFYMLLQRGERVSGDRLIDTLWHEVPGRKGSSSLRKAIQYIRQVTRSKLGIKDDLICSSKGMYQMAAGIVTNLDVDEFETLVKRAGETADNAEKRSLLEKIISVYKDGFASGWYDDWVEGIRLHYRSMYEECMVMLYDVAEKEGEYIEAMNISKRLVAINFLDEKHHCRLMRVLAQLGRFGEIEQDFQALTKALRKELKTSPHKETVEVYEALSKAPPGG